MILPNLPSRIQEIRRWHAGKYGNSELQRAKSSGLRGKVRKDRGIGPLVDAEGLLSHEMLAGPDDVTVDLLVQVVRYGAVDRVHVRGSQQVLVVSRGNRQAGKVLCKPFLHLRVGIAHTGQHGHRAVVKEMAPPCNRAAELAPHETKPYYPETDLSPRRHSSIFLSFEFRFRQPRSHSAASAASIFPTM